MNKNELRRKTEKLAKETNRRLARLEKGIDLNRGRYNPKTKRYERPDTIVAYNKKGKRIRIKSKRIVSYNMGTWASKKLDDKIGKFIINNRVTIPKVVTLTELTALNKAMQNFLKSKTSTISGIQEVEKTTKQNISNILETDVDDILDNEEVETIYNFFEDSDFSYIIKEANIPPSDLIIMMHTAKAENWTKERFISEIKNYNPDNTRLLDLDIAEKLEGIYDKLIKYDIL